MGDFVAVIDAVCWGDDGARILDRIEAVHGLDREIIEVTIRRYKFTHFKSNAEAIGWLETEAVTIATDALDRPRVRFGVAGSM